MATTTALSPATATALSLVNHRLNLLWRPPQRMLPSQWAQKNIVLSQERSARPGPLRLEKFQIEPLDTFITEPLCRRIIWLKSTQIGYSEMLNSLIGYFIDQDPRPQLLVQPTENAAKNYCKNRIARKIPQTEV